MPAYAVGHLHNVVMRPDIKEVLERIDVTVEPFEGVPHHAVVGAKGVLMAGSPRSAPAKQEIR
jgi:hypothetical protein